MKTLMSLTSLMMRHWDRVWHGGSPDSFAPRYADGLPWCTSQTIMSVSLARKLRKQPGKRSRTLSSSREARAASATASFVRRSCVVAWSDPARDIGGLHMPKVAVRPLRSSSYRFPHASPVSTSGAGKQEAAPKDRFKPLISSRKFGAGEGIRTLDPNLGKVRNHRGDSPDGSPPGESLGSPARHIIPENAVLHRSNLLLERCRLL